MPPCRFEMNTWFQIMYHTSQPTSGGRFIHCGSVTRHVPEHMLIIWGHALSVHIVSLCCTDRPFYQLMSIFCWQISQWTIYQCNFWIESDCHCFFYYQLTLFGLTVMSIDCFSNVMYDLPHPLHSLRSNVHATGPHQEPSSLRRSEWWACAGCHHHRHQGEEGLHCTTESRSGGGYWMFWPLSDCSSCTYRTPYFNF